VKFNRQRRASLPHFAACYFCIVFAAAAMGQATTPSDQSSRDARALYRINAEINFDARTYTGTSRLRWTNTGVRPTNILYFHLYANLRRDAEAVEREKVKSKLCRMNRA
jgi:hypothetical protein